LNYKQQHYFWRVTKAGGIARAAEQLRLAPQTISAQIGTLEEALGTASFRRAGERADWSCPAAGPLTVSDASALTASF